MPCTITKKQWKAAGTTPKKLGAAAFLAGKPRSANPWSIYGFGKGHDWDEGWIKARLAQEQGKKAL